MSPIEEQGLWSRLVREFNALTPHEFKLLAFFLNKAQEETGISFHTSYEQLREELAVELDTNQYQTFSQHTIQKCLDKLVETGHIVVATRHAGRLLIIQVNRLTAPMLPG